MQALRTTLEQSLAVQGLRLLGGFVPAPSDGLPPLPGGADVAVVWVVGQVGSEFWPVFAASPFAQDGAPDPLDRWSESVGDRLAQRFGGQALYPSDGPPWWPFQQWMARCTPGSTSRLMLRIHPEFGLWQACRFALLLPNLSAQDPAMLPLPPGAATDLCLQCEDQPCLAACPASAHSHAGFALQACADHVVSPGGAACRAQGCLSRSACPVGAAYRYQAPHAAFHMAAFVQQRRSGAIG